MNYKSFNLGDWIGHISGVIEDETTLDGNEMRDLVEFLSGLPKWIPVSERLPESCGVYMVSRWFSDGEESAILIDANYYDGCGDWYNDNRINWDRKLVTDKIVAWMPRPESYKTGSEDK
jgi:hypothetical protein